MKITIKALRGVCAILSFGTWIWYMLVTSDIPPVVDLSDVQIFIVLYSIIIFITIADFMVCAKYKYRGGYFTLFFELIILFIWLLTFKGSAIGTTVYDKIILFGGIITTLLQIVFQSISIINYLYK